MIGVRCYCMLVLRELGKNQPLVIESGKFIIVNIAGFLKFTGILDRDRSVIQLSVSPMWFCRRKPAQQPI